MAALLRWFRLGHQSLWVDEAASWGMAYIGQALTADRLLENIHGPLFGFVLHAWGNVAGDSEWALRMPSAIAGIATVPAAAAVAGRWLGRRVATWSAWLVAASPFLVWYGQEARNYSLVVLCACLGAWALLALRARFALAPILGYTASATAGMLSNFSFVFLAPLHLVWWLGGAGGRAKRLFAAGATVVVLALAVAPWIPQVRGSWSVDRLVTGAGEEGPALRGDTTFHWGAVPFALHGFAVGYGWGPPLRELRRGSPVAALRHHLPEVVASTLVFGALGLAGLRAVARRRRLLETLLWALAPLLLLSWVSAANVKVFHPRYAAVGAPALLMVLAAGLVDLPPRARALLVLAVAGIWAVSLGRVYFEPRYGKEDMRAAAALVRGEARVGEKVIAANTESVLGYYYRGPLPVEPFWLGFAGDRERLNRKLEAMMAGARGAWVVLSRAEDLDPSDAFARALETRYPGARRWRFEGVRVWHVPGPPEAAGRAS